MSNVSSITKIFLYQELLDQAIRTSAHPAHVHEMGNKFDAAIQEAMNNISLHNHEAMEFFGVEKIIATQLKSLVYYCFQGDVPYVPADERFLD
jgi:hypothetical protein